MRTELLQTEQSGKRRNLLPLLRAAVACGVATMAMAGCTTYVDSPPPRTVYVSPLPPPPPPPPPAPVAATVYVPPPTTVAVSPDATVTVIHTDSDFYQPLSPYGEWVVVGSFGRCWRPAHVEAGWRPYANGHWEITDAGWYWVSDEPWAWATYHYGRWDWNAQFGWFWVPQVQWAPAWVAWRQGGGYVGWAPLPPSAMIAVGGSVQIHEAAFAPRSFVFVQERHLLEPVRPSTVVVNNTTIINQTVNITKIRVVNKTVINDGPPAEVIARESGHSFRAVPARELRHQEETQAVARHRNFQAAAEKKSPERVTQEASHSATGPAQHQPASSERTPSVRSETPSRISPAPTRDVRESRPPKPGMRSTTETTTRSDAPVRVESPKSTPQPAPIVTRNERRQVQSPEPPPRATAPPEPAAENMRSRQNEVPQTRMAHRPAESPEVAPTPGQSRTARTRHAPGAPENRAEVQRPASPAPVAEPAATSPASQTRRQLRAPKDKANSHRASNPNSPEQRNESKESKARSNRKAVTPLPPQ